MNTNLIEMSFLERELLDKGFSNFTTAQKNDLVAELATRNGLAYTDVTEEYIFDYHKRLKSDLMSAVCTDSIIKGYQSTNGHFYRTTLEDQVNMIAQKEYINSHPDMTVVKWKTQDAGYIEHDVEEWVRLYYEGFSYKMMTLYKSERIKQMIKLATNDHELTAIDWDTFEADFPEENLVENDETPNDTEDLSQPPTDGSDDTTEAEEVTDGETETTTETTGTE
ncbi:hypothetical protein P4639_22615 [Priestia megaterium]|uniref:DUF4376 domain-containing protein n=1 Tax=Priestia megaterium TaxID=1404 RepID=UPI002E1A4DD4|nr:hypothetical protein [Priestia megaterium]